MAYVQDNALKGRTFSNLEDQNRYLLRWETTVADTRIHSTTRKQVQQAFEEMEQAALQPLPVGRFPFFQEVQAQATSDRHAKCDVLQVVR